MTFLISHFAQQKKIPIISLSLPQIPTRLSKKLMAAKNLHKIVHCLLRIKFIYYSSCEFFFQFISSVLFCFFFLSFNQSYFFTHHCAPTTTTFNYIDLINRLKLKDTVSVIIFVFTKFSLIIIYVCSFSLILYVQLKLLK